MKQNKNSQNQKQNKNLQKLEKTKNTSCFLLCSKHGVVFLVEMMNSCSVNFLHMPSYNLVLYLFLSLLAKCSNLELETCG
jgi:hypothetical protein